MLRFGNHPDCIGKRRLLCYLDRKEAWKVEGCLVTSMELRMGEASGPYPLGPQEGDPVAPESPAGARRSPASADRSRGKPAPGYPGSPDHTSSEASGALTTFAPHHPNPLG